MTGKFAHLIGGGIARAVVAKKAKAAPKAKDFSHLYKAARPMPAPADTHAPAPQKPAVTTEQAEAKRLAAEMIAAAKRCVR